MARYPIDDVTDKKSCELHQKMANLSMKVAVGYAIPSPPGQLYHCRLIPPGYARVWVDEVMKDVEGLELEIPRDEGEATLGKIMHGSIILWRKENIMFPNWAPRIPTPPRPPTPPSPRTPPRDPSVSPARSLMCQPTLSRDPSVSPARSPTR
jgi:hypothetical protein